MRIETAAISQRKYWHGLANYYGNKQESCHSWLRFQTLVMTLLKKKIGNMKRRWNVRGKILNSIWMQWVFPGAGVYPCRKEKLADGKLYPAFWGDDRAKDRVGRVGVICRQCQKSRWGCQRRQRIRRKEGWGTNFWIQCMKSMKRKEILTVT